MTKHSLVVVSTDELKNILDDYVKFVEILYVDEKRQEKERVIQEMAKPTWFGLKKGITNPTDEQIKRWLVESDFFETLWFTSPERHRESRLALATQYYRAIKGSSTAHVFVSVADVCRLMEASSMGTINA
jgi:hypothetical protein